MRSTETAQAAPTRQTNRIDIELSRWQYDAVFRHDPIRWLFLIGGRASGKSFIEKIRFVRWMKLSTELHWGIFGSTDAQMHTIVAPFVDLIVQMGIDYRFEKPAPQEWLDRWDRDGIKYPAKRLRSHKMLILENGAHFVTGSIVNNAYTRFKSIEFNGIYIGEGTEPGITLDALTTLWGACRCGKATKGKDGVWRCMEPGHLHQLVLGGNVPLNDPGHWIYKQDRALKAKELQREKEGKPPFYKRIKSSSYDNPRTGADFIDGLGAAMDEETFKQQTSGDLEVNVAALTYHEFSETGNVLDSLRYSPTRPLHLWFDFNATPAVAGWGHDLLYNEIPAPYQDRFKTLAFFGVVGELFSGNESMSTYQIAQALVEDPTRDSRCGDCTHELAGHIELPTGNGFICTVCSYNKAGSYCRGVPTSYEQSRKNFLHLDPGSKWRGLINHRGAIFVYGDATGKNSSSQAISKGGNISILRDVFGENLGERVHFRFKNANPAESLRVMAVNRALRARNGVRGLYFGSWCSAHLDDAREVIPDPKSPSGQIKKVQYKADDPYSLRTHAFDGLGYMVDVRWPALNSNGGFMPMMSEVDLSDTPLGTEWPRP